MDESGCFFKSLSSTELAKKGEIQRWKEIEEASDFCFFVSDNVGKGGKPIVIWRNKNF